MFPAWIGSFPEGDVVKGGPPRLLRNPYQSHACFLEGSLPLFKVALDTAARDLCPCRRPSESPGKDVVKVQLALPEGTAAILAGVFIPQIYILAS